MNKDPNERRPLSAPSKNKEPWDFQKFIDSYNAHSGRYGGLRFILRDDEELKDLEDSYLSDDNGYAHTISEYAEVVFTSEQKVDDLDVKYKK